MVFSFGGSGKGKRNSRSRTVEGFSQYDTSSKQVCLCYILYVDQWVFHCNMCQKIAKVPPVLDSQDRHVYCSSFDNTLKTMKGILHLVPSRTPRSSGYGVLWCLIHMWSMLHVISVIFLV
jgi:hypothetical protein